MDAGTAANQWMDRKPQTDEGKTSQNPMCRGIYGRYVFPYLGMMAAGRLKRIRRRLIQHASGNVLEIGAGAGFNIPFLSPDISSYVAVDPSIEGMALKPSTGPAG